MRPATGAGHAPRAAPTGDGVRRPAASAGSGAGEGGGGRGDGIGRGRGRRAPATARPRRGRRPRQRIEPAPAHAGAPLRPSLRPPAAEPPRRPWRARSATDGDAPPARQPSMRGRAAHGSTRRARRSRAASRQDEVQRVVRGAVAAHRVHVTPAQLTAEPADRAAHIDVRVVVDALGEVKSAERHAEPGRRASSGCVTASFRSAALPGARHRRRALHGVVRSRRVGDGRAPTARRPERNVPKALAVRGPLQDRDGAPRARRQGRRARRGEALARRSAGRRPGARRARRGLRGARRPARPRRAPTARSSISSRPAPTRAASPASASSASHDPRALALAVDTFGKAARAAPRSPGEPPPLAFALLKAGEHEKAFEAIATGAMRTYPSGRFRGVDRILREDLGLIAAAWAHGAAAARAPRS